MNETAQGALIGGFIVLLGSLINLWFNDRARKADQQQRATERRDDYQEWYKRTLFEKRLTGVQQAYAWLMKLNVAISRANPQQPDSAENVDLKRLAEEARDWYDHNALFLEDGLPGVSPFIGLTNAASLYASGRAELIRIWDHFIEADKMVKQRATELGLVRLRGEHDTH
ncbi:MAG: hypothetical protein HY676_04580 [Chloroflexi bacterium]|nr:hypothetical protein [Chloroflexota bacterium]